MAAITPVITLILPQDTEARDPNAVVFDVAGTGFDDGWFADGPVEIDISADVQTVQIRRGRDRSIDAPQAGTCSLTLRNDRANAGDYDPLNENGPYWPWLQAATIRVTVHGNDLYTGDVSGVTLDETFPAFSVARIECTERYARLARYPTGYYAFDGTLQYLGHYVERLVLDADQDATTTVTYNVGGRQAPPDVDPIGDVTAADEIIAQIERTDAGLFYMGGDGSYNYLGQDELIARMSSVTFSDQAAATIRYSTVERGSLFDRLINQVTMTRTWDRSGFNDWTLSGGNPTYQNDPSMFRYGTHAQSVALYPFYALGGFDLVIAEYCARVILNAYAAPVTAPLSVSIPTARYSTGTQDTILTLEIGDVVTVARTPPGEGATSTDLLIIGIEHDIAVRSHTTRFRFAPQPSV